MWQLNLMGVLDAYGHALESPKDGQFAEEDVENSSDDLNTTAFLGNEPCFSVLASSDIAMENSEPQSTDAPNTLAKAQSYDIEPECV